MNYDSPSKKLTTALYDITNNMQDSPNSNVFKRLSTSPAKKYPKDLRKPALRLSPKKGRSPSKEINESSGRPFRETFQTTPKRLLSPDSLKGYIPQITQSVDRASFRPSSPTRITDIVFQTSPTKNTFSGTTTIGGDGTLSRIRTRFGGGIRSPQRPHEQQGRTTGSPLKSRVQQDLIQKLHEDALKSQIPTAESFESATKENTRLNSIRTTSGSQFKINKPQSLMRRKKVKFEIPEEEHIKRELQGIKKLLLELVQRQDQLESRLYTLERGKIKEEDET